MKKIFLLLAFAGATVLTSCNNDDNQVFTDTDTIGETFDVNVNFLPGDYTVTIPLDPAIFDSDVVLVYRQTGLTAGNPIWRLVPQTYFFGDGGELEYITDFSVNDLTISIDSNFNLAEVPQFTQNQNFRIVIVPADFSTNVDVNNYDAVMSALDLGAGDIKTIEKPIIY